MRSWKKSCAKECGKWRPLKAEVNIGEEGQIGEERQAPTLNKCRKIV